MDLSIDKTTSITFGTVTASRVRSREDILILRPFPLWLYQRGAPEGVGLLLQHLRGEVIDWEAYRESREPSATCDACEKSRRYMEFTDAQWQLARANRPSTCVYCGKGEDAKPRQTVHKPMAKRECFQCKVFKIEDAFPRAQLRSENASVTTRQCLMCLKSQKEIQCNVCGATKPQGEFSPTVITLPRGRCCITCQKQAQRKRKSVARVKGWFKCRGCDELLPNSAQANAMDRRCQYCGNCSSGTTRTTDVHTCRRCAIKFTEKVKDGNRPRLCLKCRPS